MRMTASFPFALVAVLFLAQVSVGYVEDVRLGSDTVNYIDPELCSELNLMTFQDGHRRAWLSLLDPLTGRLRSATGMDSLVDTALVDIAVTLNGPEFGIDDSGSAVFYTKNDSAGLPQVWRVDRRPGMNQPTQLTASRPGSYGNIASCNEDAPTTGILYARRDSLNWLSVFIADENQADSGARLPLLGQTSARPIAGTRDWVYARVTSLNPPTTQLTRFDWVTKQTRIMTDDPGLKSAPWALPAPEFGGELLYVADVDTHQLGIWRDMGRPNGMLTKVDSIMLPVGSPHRYISSLEPVLAATNDSTTYFTLVLNLRSDIRNPGDGAIWVLGLGWDPEDRFAMRVDSGAVSGDTALRYEPEVYVGTEEVFVMYNVLRPGINHLRRCRTGIALATTSLHQEGDCGFRPQELAASIARGHLYIDVMAQETGRQWEWDLLDAAGRRVTKLGSGTNDVRVFAPGVYFVRTRNPSDALVQTRVVLVR